MSASSSDVLATGKSGPLIAPATAPSRWLLFAAFTLAALALRAYRLDSMEYKMDEALLEARARQVFAGEWIQTGIRSSQGVPNPPMAPYLFSLPLFVGKDSLTLAWMPVLFGSLAVGATYLFGETWFGRRTGLLSGLLALSSPWGVALSRKIWAQDLLPLLGILLLGLAVESWSRRTTRSAILFPILFSIAVQIHWSVAVAAPLLIFLAAVGLARGPRSAWGIGLILSAAMWIPFGQYLAAVGPSAYFRQLTGAPRWLHLTDNFARSLRHFVDLADGGGFHYVTDASGVEFLNNPGPMRWNEMLGGVLAAVGTAAVLRRRPIAAGLWLVGWSTLFVLGFGYGAKMPHPHYLAFVLPCSCLLIAAAPSIVDGKFGERVQRSLGAAGGLLVLVVAGVNAWTTYGFLQRMEIADWRGEYGAPYRDSLAAAQWLCDYAAGRPKETILLYPSDEHFAVRQLTKNLGKPLDVLETPRAGVLAAFCLRPKPNQPFKLAVVDAWTSPDGRLAVYLCRGEDVWKGAQP